MLIQNPLSAARSNHSDVRFRFIRYLFRTRKINVEYVASYEQHADILTKVLSRGQFPVQPSAFDKSFRIWYFSTGQIVSSGKCTSTSPKAGRLRTKLASDRQYLLQSTMYQDAVL